MKGEGISLLLRLMLRDIFLLCVALLAISQESSATSCTEAHTILRMPLRRRGVSMLAFTNTYKDPASWQFGPLFKSRLITRGKGKEKNQERVNQFFISSKGFPTRRDRSSFFSTSSTIALPFFPRVSNYHQFGMQVHQWNVQRFRIIAVSRQQRYFLFETLVNV